MAQIVGEGVEGRWRAAYAWSAERGGPGLTVRRFRRAFELLSVPGTFVVHVSADSRYRLWVNGQAAGRGPLKGTLQHYHYESYDLAPHLVVGRNVIAAEVRWFGVDSPTSEVHSARAGFVFQGPEGAALDTPGEWRVQVDRAILPDKRSFIVNAHVFLGHLEQVHAASLPMGWEKSEYDDSDWESVICTGPADVADTHGVSDRYQTLYPRELPALVEEPRRFARTIIDQRPVDHLMGEPPLGWRLEPGQEGELVLDAGALTTGYPELAFEGGEGRTVEIIYGESITRFEEGERELWPIKGLRDDLSFGEVNGYRDTVMLAGGPLRYEPFHWRTFWFVRLRVSAGETPFVLRDAGYRFTTYPQTLRATFDASLPEAARMWEISWRTLQLCAHETYEDCPYFEQLNYIADTRLQAMASLVLAGETALPKKALSLYHDSVRPDGLIHSRVPSIDPQVKPYFALLWVLMVEDYWRWVGPRERAYVRSLLHGVDGILWFFRERLRDDGFVGVIPPWTMVDRVDGWPVGTPPAVSAGESTYLTSLFVMALDAAIRLHIQAGEPVDAVRWQELAPRVRCAVRQGAWSEEEGLYLEGPGRRADGLSQHSQVAAILAEVATAEQSARILMRLTTDPALFRTKFMHSFYLARALEKTGGYAAFPSHVLSFWYDALAERVSTWPEYPNRQRSDCHAWSSWIAVDFVTCLLGIRPALPGFDEIEIAPHTEAVDWARGSAPTPHGLVTIDWRRDPKSDTITLDGETPDGVPTIVRLGEGEPVRFETGGAIHLNMRR